MEKMTKDEMQREFGKRGVENPTVLDLIFSDSESGTVVLVMYETRPFRDAETQLRQLQDKIDRYLSYVLDGFLIQHYPQYEGIPVRMMLQTVHPPEGRAKSLLAAAEKVCREFGVPFSVSIVPDLKLD
jgi:hypothetical protein